MHVSIFEVLELFLLQILGDGRWLKFDDEMIMSVSFREVCRIVYECNTKPDPHSHRNILVYIRDSEIDKVLEKVYKSYVLVYCGDFFSSHRNTLFTKVFFFNKTLV